MTHKPNGLPRKLFALRTGCSSFLDEAHDPEQNARSDEGYYDGADQSEAGIYTEQAEDPSADHGADDADDDVHQHAEAAALHYFSGQKTGDQTDDAPPEQSTEHGCLLCFLRVKSCAWSLFAAKTGLLLSQLPGNVNRSPKK